jgi:hypothetical protein
VASGFDGDFDDGKPTVREVLRMAWQFAQFVALLAAIYYGAHWVFAILSYVVPH